jgi:hypothetical protein
VIKMKNQTVEELRETRNAIVKKYDMLKQPLRTKREVQFKSNGPGLNETEWEMFDLIDKMMNEELAPIDYKLFMLAAV